MQYNNNIIDNRNKIKQNMKHKIKQKHSSIQMFFHF